MGIYETGEVAGFQLGDEIVCPDCISKEESADLTEDEILPTIDENDYFFCNRCKKRLKNP